MAYSKEFFSRIIHKHDTEENWNTASVNKNFIPLKGEIIVYDKDATHNYERIKIGDGETKVSNLPFSDALIATANFVEENRDKANNVELIDYTVSELVTAYKEGKKVLLFYNNSAYFTISGYFDGNLFFICDAPELVKARIHFVYTDEKFGTLTNLVQYTDDINENYEDKILKYNDGKAVWSETKLSDLITIDTTVNIEGEPETFDADTLGGYLPSDFALSLEAVKKTTNITTENTNLNDYNTDGVYYFPAEYAPTNRPTGTDGWLMVFNRTNITKQIWFRQGIINSTHHQIFVRGKNAAGVWADWVELMTSKGGTFVGDITLKGDPTANLHAATKQYVDNSVGGIADNAMPKSGGTFTGNITLKGDPTNDLHAATKQYVDKMMDNVNIDGTFTSPIKIKNTSLTLENNYRPTIYFNNNDSKEVNRIYSDFDYNRLNFSQTPLDQINNQSPYKEIYYLPNPTAGLDKSYWYQILTARNPVTIAQGGTGATSASAALTNLGAATSAQGTKADNAMPKSGGKFTGNVSFSAGKTLDFINKDGGKLRLIGGSSSNISTIRVVDSSNTTLANLLQVDTTTGNITGGTIMPKSGGTFSNDVTFNGSKSTFNTQAWFYKNPVIETSTSIADNGYARLTFQVKQTDNNITSAGHISVYDDHDAAAYGTNMVIQSNGNMIIGSGESPTTYYTNNLLDSASEKTYIISDNDISLITNANTIANAKTATVNTDGTITTSGANRSAAHVRNTEVRTGGTSGTLQSTGNIIFVRK